MSSCCTPWKVLFSHGENNFDDDEVTCEIWRETTWDDDFSEGGSDVNWTE